MMKTLKMNFASLTLIFACLTLTLSAQDYNPDGHKWGAHPDDFDPPFTQAELETAGFQPSCHISRTKAIYTAMQQGDVYGLTSNIAESIKWNGHQDFLYPVGDPHYNIDGMSETLFNKIGQGYSNWEVQELIFVESSNNTVTVNGTYEAIRTGLKISVPFVHIWTWKGSAVTQFQHYETPQTIAERP